MPDPPHRAAIALGSNLPPPGGTLRDNLVQALERLGTLGQVTAVSSFLLTAPVGYLAQPDFLNAAAVLATEMPPQALMPALLNLEQAMGRTRSAGLPAKGPRLIDLDLLLYDDLILDTPGLTLPHPEMHRRAFVLAPLTEVAPAWLHPGLHLSVAALYQQLLQD